MKLFYVEDASEVGIEAFVTWVDWYLFFKAAPVVFEARECFAACLDALLWEGFRTDILGSGIKFDAIFAACDLIAIGAMRALQESGKNVPKDVAVAGFDDIQIASFTNPALTTAKQNTKLAGELLVNKLLALIAGFQQGQ